MDRRDYWQHEPPADSSQQNEAWVIPAIATCSQLSEPSPPQQEQEQTSVSQQEDSPPQQDVKATEAAQLASPPSPPQQEHAHASVEQQVDVPPQQDVAIAESQLLSPPSPPQQEQAQTSVSQQDDVPVQHEPAARRRLWVSIVSVLQAQPSGPSHAEATTSVPVDWQEARAMTDRTRLRSRFMEAGRGWRMGPTFASGRPTDTRE